METVVALGSVACNIARKFENYDEYEVYKIDHEDSKEDNYLKISDFEDPEQYEKSPPTFKNFLKKVTGEVLFIVSGASRPAGASLIILEHLHKKCKISILYVKTETDFLGEKKVLQERAVFNILQQYTRSGLFERMFLLCNQQMDPLIEDASISGYFDSLNEMIVSTFHMINFFDHVKSVVDTFSKPAETARLTTIGLFDTKSGKENLFFPLDKARESRYYYGIPKKKLANEKTLHRKILNQVKDKRTENMKVSYGIYSTDYTQECGFVLVHSSFVQES